MSSPVEMKGSTRKLPPQIRFYLYSEDIDAFKMMKEYALRHEQTVTALMKQIIKEWVRKNCPGNPQRSLGFYEVKRAPDTLTKLCEQCDRPATYIVFLWENESKCQEHYLCDVHSKAALRGPWVRKGRRKL